MEHPGTETLQPFVCRTGALRPRQLEFLRELAAETDRLEPAPMYRLADGEAVMDTQSRTALRRNLEAQDLAREFLGEDLQQICEDANRRFFGATLFGPPTENNLNIYGPRDHLLRWHQDFGPRHLKTRKLAVVALIEASPDLRGGDLQFFDGATKTVPLQPGDVVVFPSFIYHRVIPVERGRRVSLVSWFHGPLWR